jgi:hypothetical protein
MGEKSTGKNSKAGQGLFRSRDSVTSGEKGPHVQNILPDMASSGHFRSNMRMASLPVAPPHCSPSNVTRTVPIYYLHRYLENIDAYRLLWHKA